MIDASSVLQAAASPSGFDDLLVHHQLVAPSLMWSQAHSALHEARWRGEVSRDLGDTILARLLRAPIRRSAPERLRSEAWRVADELGWAKTYDAEYVALARILDCALLTIDARLARGARRLIPIVDPSELQTEGGPA